MNPQDSELTADMARAISNSYLQNLHRVQAEFDIENLTRYKADKATLRAEVTSDLCAELMDSIIMARFDYLVEKAVEYKLRNIKEIERLNK